MEIRPDKDRRSNIERRVFTYSFYLPERRNLKDRRKQEKEPAFIYVEKEKNRLAESCDNKRK